MSFQRFRGVSLSKYSRIYEIFGKPQNSKKISISWHSRLSLSVGIKDYIIGKKETNLNGGVFDIFLCLLFCHGFTTVLGSRISPLNYKPTIQYVATVQSGSFFDYNVSTEMLSLHII